jgi:hypothetical protein
VDVPVKYDPNTRLLKVRFDAGEIPNHIQGNQRVFKTIDITYKEVRYINNRRN